MVGATQPSPPPSPSAATASTVATATGVADDADARLARVAAELAACQTDRERLQASAEAQAQAIDELTQQKAVLQRQADLLIAQLAERPRSVPPSPPISGALVAAAGVSAVPPLNLKSVVRDGDNREAAKGAVLSPRLQAALSPRVSDKYLSSPRAVVEKERDALKAEVVMLRAALQQTGSEAAWRQEKTTLLAERDAVVKRVNMLRMAVTANQSEQSALLLKDNDALTQEKDALSQEKQAWVQEKTALIQVNAVLTQEKESLVQEKTDLAALIAGLREASTPFRQEIADLTTRLAEHVARVRTLEETVRTAESDLTGTKQRLESAQSMHLAQEATITTLTHEWQAQSSATTAAQLALRQLVTKLEPLRAAMGLEAAPRDATEGPTPMALLAGMLDWVQQHLALAQEHAAALRARAVATPPAVAQGEDASLAARVFKQDWLVALVVLLIGMILGQLM
jgi:chromosome segregation ATPase